MTLSNGKIERIAVNAVTTIANKPNSYLIPNIPVNDKGISFDGEISVLIDDSEKKESLEGIIPVQVKGTEVKQFHEGVRKFSLDMAHYQNFYKRDGALLLVVEVNAQGETKIFYKSLLPLELSQIIKQFGQQKSRSVELRPLEETQLYTVCRKFLNEQKYQPKMLVEQQPIPEHNFSGYTLTSLTFDPAQNGMESIFHHDFTVYGVFNDALFPLHIGRIESLGTTGVYRFVTEGEQFDLAANISVKDHKITFLIESIFYFDFDVKNKKFHIRFLGFHTLEAQIKILPFVIHLLSGHRIEIAGGMFSLDEDARQLEGELQEILKHKKFLKNLREVFKKLGIPEKTVFKETDDSNLSSTFDFLTSAFLFNEIEGIRLENPDQGSFINLSVGDRVVVLLYNPYVEEKLTSAFSEDMLKKQFLVHHSTESFPHSVYIKLSVESLAHGINLDPHNICESFDQFDPFLNDVAFNLTNEFCLMCINAFDQSGDYRLLDVAKHIFDKFQFDCGGAVHLEQIVLINLYQIQKRKEGHLTELENSRLYQIKMEAMVEKNTELLFCINVLLENRIEAELTFNQLEKGRKEYYHTLPIFKLYQNLVSN